MISRVSRETIYFFSFVSCETFLFNCLLRYTSIYFLKIIIILNFNFTHKSRANQTGNTKKETH